MIVLVPLLLAAPWLVAVAWVIFRARGSVFGDFPSSAEQARRRLSVL